MGIEALGWIATAVMGLTLGLMGGGGSILTVPILVYLFGIDPLQSTSYSLIAVGLIAILGAGRYFKQGSIDFKAALWFAPPSVAGVLLARTALVPALPESWVWFGFEVTKSMLIMLVFALVMIVAAAAMIRGGLKAAPAEEQTSQAAIHPVAIALEGLLVGGVTGFVGAGGGFLIVPALHVWAKVPMKRAVATSLFIIGVKSIIGFLGDWMSGGIAFEPVFVSGFVLVAAIGMMVGTQLSRFVSAAHLKLGFGWFTVAMALAIFYQETMA
jgi:uncharacterized membrane protein YfcA